MTAARAGDVIQFKDYTVTIETTTKVVNADGSWDERTQIETMSRPHHTAVVAQPNSTGDVGVYEQNVNGSRAVQNNKLQFVSRDEAPVSTTVNGTTTTVTKKVKVTGTAQFYRPQVK